MPSLRRYFLIIGSLIFLFALTGCGGGSGGGQSSNVASIEVTQGQIVRVGDSRELLFIARDSVGNIVSLSANLVSWQVTSGQDKLQFVNGRALGIAEGSATVIASYNGISSLPATVSVSLTAPVNAKWTIIVFLNSANDLDDFAPLNVNQMEAGLNSSDVNIVVQWKRIPSYATVQPWTGVRRYLITHDTDPNQVNSTLLETLSPTLDMGDWHNLQTFIVWTMANYPADRYALVIWNHGNGILRSAKTAAITRDVSYDVGTGNSIGVSQLDDALNIGQPLDMVVFDASLMQMMEVAWQIRNQCNYMVGSEESPPGAGYPYDAVMSGLSANPSMSPVEFGQIWVDQTINAYQGKSGIAQSLIDTSMLQPIVTTMNSLSEVLIAKRTQYLLPLTTAGDAPNYKNPRYKDLHNLVGRFASETGDTSITAAATLVQAAVQNAVIAEGHSEDLNFSKGIAIYYPNGGSYSSQFELLSFSTAAPKWKQWIMTAP